MFTANKTNKETVVEVPKSLTTKASLGAASNALQFVIRLIVSFVITPIIINGLGKELYGAWTIIQQIVGYVALADLRATSIIKLTLAVKQHDNDFHYKRQQVGASILVLLFVFPIILLLGGFVIWFAPTIIKTDPQYNLAVRIALGIGLVGIIIDLLSSIPGNILRGVNLEYKAMGLNAFVMAFTSSLSAVAIWLSTGLPGLSLATELGGCITGTVQYFIARANIPWFGIEWPDSAILKHFWQRTIWAFLGSLGFVMQNSSDLLLVGMVLNPSAAAAYGITGLVLRMVNEPLFSIVGSANPGLADLCGRGEWKRVEQVRNESHLITFFVMFIVSIGVLILNHAFINLWLGSSYYVGDTLNLLLVIISLQSIPLRLDTMTLDSMLKFKERAIATLTTSALGMGLGALLATYWGMEGIAIGVITGRLFAILWFQFIISTTGEMKTSAYINWMIRPLFFGGLLLFVSYMISLDKIGVFGFILVGGIVFIVSSSCLWLLGLSQLQRSMLFRRFNSQITIFSRHMRKSG
jgi:O-antigen/teichoic acid export membrane protein